MSRQQGADSGKRARMATIDVDKLRDYMTDYFGTAMFNGFPAAILDLSDIENMSGYELCQKRNPSASTFAILKMSRRA